MCSRGLALRTKTDNILVWTCLPFCVTPVVPAFNSKILRQMATINDSLGKKAGEEETALAAGLAGE